MFRKCITISAIFRMLLKTGRIWMLGIEEHSCSGNIIHSLLRCSVSIAVYVFTLLTTGLIVKVQVNLYSLLLNCATNVWFKSLLSCSYVSWKHWNLDLQTLYLAEGQGIIDMNRNGNFCERTWIFKIVAKARAAL